MRKLITILAVLTIGCKEQKPVNKPVNTQMPKPKYDRFIVNDEYMTVLELKNDGSLYVYDSAMAIKLLTKYLIECQNGK